VLVVLAKIPQTWLLFPQPVRINFYSCIHLPGLIRLGYHLVKTLATLRGENNFPVIISDQNGIVEFINPSFTSLFGWNQDEIVGQPLSTIIPPNLHDAHNLGFSRFLATGKGRLLNQPLVLKAITKEGRVFDAEHIIVAENETGQWRFGAQIRPL
jgi:PAS domain S-box-containing protein